MTYVQKVNDIYYYRIRIPKDLRGLFKGAEFKRSLQTKSLTMAKRLGILWAGRTERLFTTIRTRTLNNNQIKKLIEDYVGYTLRKDDEERIDYGVYWNGNITARAEFDPVEDAIVEDLEDNKYDEVKRRLNEFLEYKGLIIDVESYEYKALCRDIAYAHINEIHQINVDRDMGNFDDKYYNSDSLESTLQEDQSSPPGSVSTQQEEQSSHGSVSAQSSPVVFSELINDYVSERRAKKDISLKSIKEFQTRLTLFQEMIGDPDIKTLNRKLFVECLDKAVRLPPRRNIMPEFKDKTIDELLSLKVNDTLGVKTLRNHFSALSTLLGWAELNDYIQKNPAKSLMPKDDRDEESRIPYDKDDLQKLIYAIKDLENYQKFIPLVSLYSGLRSDEICQLYKEDIREENNVLVFDVNNKQDKKVKTSNSKRLVPVHPQLIELGFMEYVDNINHERVWPELSRGSRGYSHNWTDFYGKLNRKNITNDPRKVFHSLRKSFANNLKQNMIEDSVLSELLGHEQSSLGMSVYSNKYNPDVLLKQMTERLDFELDLSSLL